MLHIPPPLTLASSKLYCCPRPSSAPSLSSPQVLSLSHFLLQLYTGGANGEVIVPPNMVVSSLYEWSTDFHPRCSLCRGKDLPFICCNHVNVCEKNKGVDTSTVLQQSVMEQTCVNTVDTSTPKKKSGSAHSACSSWRLIQQYKYSIDI